MAPDFDRAFSNRALVLWTEERDGHAIVVVEGEIDLATAPVLAEGLEHAHGDVVVDLTRVAFLDSSGIAAIVRAQIDEQRAGGSITLRNPRANVRRALEITGLDGWIESPSRGALS